MSHLTPTDGLARKLLAAVLVAALYLGIDESRVYTQGRIFVPTNLSGYESSPTPFHTASSDADKDDSSRPELKV